MIPYQSDTSSGDHRPSCSRAAHTSARKKSHLPWRHRLFRPDEQEWRRCCPGSDWWSDTIQGRTLHKSNRFTLHVCDIY